MWHKDQLQELSQKTFFGKSLTIEHLHGSLPANLHVPPNFRESGGAYPAVLMLHGFGGNRHEHNGLFIKTASALARAGMVALRFDFRGFGETCNSTREVTIESQIQDAGDAFEHLLEYPFVDRKRTAVLGLSFGGLTAACLAGRREDVAALVLWEPVFDMKGCIKRLYGNLSLKAVRARGYFQAGMVQVSEQFFTALDSLSVAETVEHFSRPVLIVQGVADTIVPVDTAYQWKRAFQSTEVEIDLLQEADHCFTRDAHTWAAIERSAAFLEAAFHAPVR